MSFRSKESRKFKKSIDSSATRRVRDDGAVSLRKKAREEQMLKRRRLAGTGQLTNDDDDLTADQIPMLAVAMGETLAKLCEFPDGLPGAPRPHLPQHSHLRKRVASGSKQVR